MGVIRGMRLFIVETETNGDDGVRSDEVDDLRYTVEVEPLPLTFRLKMLSKFSRLSHESSISTPTMSPG